MNQEQLKNKLLEEKSRLEKELSGIATNDTDGKEVDKDNWEANKTTEVDTADENELADAFEEQSNNEGIVLALEAQLKDVNAALEKFENNTYGICEVAGCQIETDRLEANPAARTCKAHMNS